MARTQAQMGGHRLGDIPLSRSRGGACLRGCPPSTGLLKYFGTNGPPKLPTNVHEPSIAILVPVYGLFQNVIYGRSRQDSNFGIKSHKLGYSPSSPSSRVLLGYTIIISTMRWRRVTAASLEVRLGL